MDMDLVVKIAIPVISMLCLWRYKRRITALIAGMLVNGDVKSYQDRSISEIMTSVRDKLDRILK